MHPLSILPHLWKRTGPSSCVLSTDPLVYYLMDWELKPGVWKTRELLAALRFIPATLLVQTSWIVKPGWKFNAFTELLDGYRQKQPKHRIIVLASDPEEFEYLRDRGLEVCFMNQNALLSEKVFKPLPEITKRFDAVYDARLIGYKRHFLAARVRSLSLHCHNWKDCDPAYAEETRQCMAHAHWYKDPYVKGPVRWFSNEEVNAMLNESRCGLCLSSEEGCMYAAIQYLLAGLPVVTTKNKGGRDVLFDAEHVRWVEDDPDAVAEAVGHWVLNPPDPWKVRSAVLEKMMAHRKVFVELVNGVFRDAGKADPWSLSWPDSLPNKLHDSTRLPAGLLRDIFCRRNRW